MLGAITGDVVGSAYEFHNTKDYKFEMFPKGASFTDDSVMTLAVTPCWNHSWEGDAPQNRCCGFWAVRPSGNTERRDLLFRDGWKPFTGPLNRSLYLFCPDLGEDSVMERLPAVFQAGGFRVEPVKKPHEFFRSKGAGIRLSCKEIPVSLLGEDDPGVFLLTGDGVAEVLFPDSEGFIKERGIRTHLDDICRRVGKGEFLYQSIHAAPCGHSFLLALEDGSEDHVKKLLRELFSRRNNPTEGHCP